MRQGQFQTLQIRAAHEAGILGVERRLQPQQAGHVRALQPTGPGPANSRFRQAQFGVQRLPQRRDQPLDHGTGRVARPVQAGRAAKQSARVVLHQRGGHAPHLLAGGQAQGRLHARTGHGISRCQHAFQQALTVAHGPVGQPPDELQRLRLGVHAFLHGDAAQLARDFLRRQAAKAVVLAAAQDGRDDLLRLGGCQDKDHVLGRLFQRLQERIEGRPAHHVRLVENVDLLAAAHGAQADLLAQFAYVVHAVVAGRVDFHHVRVVARTHRHAAFALAAGLDARPCASGETVAVGGHGDQPGGGGLADAPWAAEQVGVAHPALLHRGLQHVLDVFLTHHLIPANGACALVDG